MSMKHPKFGNGGGGYRRNGQLQKPLYQNSVTCGLTDQQYAFLLRRTLGGISIADEMRKIIQQCMEQDQQHIGSLNDMEDA